jgi:hypothetical protein
MTVNTVKSVRSYLNHLVLLLYRHVVMVLLALLKSNTNCVYKMLCVRLIDSLLPGSKFAVERYHSGAGPHRICGKRQTRIESSVYWP